MEKNVIGFQYDPKTGRYIGEYEFPNNLDQEAIHVPPHTTLERPPVAEGKVAVMVDGVWQLQSDPNANKTRPPIDDYFLITEAFIAMMVDQGLWTSEDQQKRDAAIAEHQRKQAELEALMAEAKANAEQAAGGAA